MRDKSGERPGPSENQAKNSCANCGLQRPFKSCENKVNVVVTHTTDNNFIANITWKTCCHFSYVEVAGLSFPLKSFQFLSSLKIPDSDFSLFGINLTAKL